MNDFQQLRDVYLWLIVLAPFAGFLLNGLLGKRLPRSLVTAIALLSSLAAFGAVLNAILIAYDMFAYVVGCKGCLQHSTYLLSTQTLGNWISTGSLHIDFSSSSISSPPSCCWW